MDWLQAAMSGVSAGFNFFSQKKANETNVKLSREQMAFQERMSNTAVQRHAKDLEAAGFNRLLAAGANGASTPSGSAATVKAPEITPIDIIGIQKARAEVDRTKAETILLAQNAGKSLEEKFNLQEQNKLISAQVELTKAKVKSELVSRGYTRVQAAKVVQGMFGTTTVEGGASVYGVGLKGTSTKPTMSAKEAEQLVLDALQGA